MSLINLAETAAGLPEAWDSRSLGLVGTSCVKVLRMDERPVKEETHAVAEALLVLEGRLELDVKGEPIVVGAGELYMMPARTPHTVRPGSHGTLVIVEVPED
ncbi:cupin domain-containing protein [Streptomyces sp. NBC_01198]|uniref:cupin domain-containing protein n=1 Tax=Streptomyces sp. NBC_01198 TaxID=2903769 RepID=UPI002E13225C|nr:cupin domain-containing protein [Streptomyces sp. NBC_01198]